MAVSVSDCPILTSPLPAFGLQSSAKPPSKKTGSVPVLDRLGLSYWFSLAVISLLISFQLTDSTSLLPSTSFIICGLWLFSAVLAGPGICDVIINVKSNYAFVVSLTPRRWLMSGIKNEINLDFKSKCLKRIPATTTSVDSCADCCECRYSITPASVTDITLHPEH